MLDLMIEEAERNRAALTVRWDELQVEEMLKNNIIDQAEAHYGPFFPAGSIFRVITGWHKPETEKIFGTAYLLAHPSKTNFTQRRIIDGCGSKVERTIQCALELLLDKLESTTCGDNYEDAELKLDWVKEDTEKVSVKMRHFAQPWELLKRRKVSRQRCHSLI